MNSGSMMPVPAGKVITECFYKQSIWRPNLISVAYQPSVCTQSEPQPPLGHERPQEEQLHKSN